MAKKKTRRTARRVKDKWKSKSWYRIVAPDMFEGRVIGESPAADPELLLGRVCEVNLQDLAGDFSKIHIKAKLKVNGVRGGECISRFVGHDMTTDYIRRLTRRRRSKVDSVFDVSTKEGYKVRIKVLAITDKRVNSSIKNSLRARQEEIIREEAGNSTLSILVQKMLFGKLAASIKKDCKDIYPLKRVEIKKSEVLSVPTEEDIPEKVVTDKELKAEKEEEAKEEAELEEEVTKVKKKELSTKEQVLKEYQQIEGVGPTMAEKLYDGGFKTMEQLKTASREKLLEVEGVGPSFSEKIYKALHPNE